MSTAISSCEAIAFSLFHFFTFLLTSLTSNVAVCRCPAGRNGRMGGKMTTLSLSPSTRNITRDIRGVCGQRSKTRLLIIE